MINNIDLTVYSPYNASLMFAVNNLSEDFWLNVKEYSDNQNYSFFGYAFGGGSAKDIFNPDKWILIKDTDLLSIRPSENPNATPDSVYEWDVYNGLVIGLKDDQFELFDYYKLRGIGKLEYVKLQAQDLADDKIFKVIAQHIYPNNQKRIVGQGSGYTIAEAEQEAAEIGLETFRKEGTTRPVPSEYIKFCI